MKNNKRFQKYNLGIVGFVALSQRRSFIRRVSIVVKRRRAARIISVKRLRAERATGGAVAKFAWKRRRIIGCTVERGVGQGGKGTGGGFTRATTSITTIGC